jgi:purine-nucleoside phosphorylase
VGVKGHSGELFIGHFCGVAVMVLSGRAHFYEGHTMASVTFPVGVLAAYGIRELLLTNAAGGINPAFRPGDFMSAEDHINFMGVNPLRGMLLPNFSPFVDLTETYDPTLRKLLLEAARITKVRLHSGVYLAVCGPTYETPAEIQAFAKLGADAVGMSTVPEALVARQHGLKIAALSCITNRAASRKGEPLSHQHVLQTAAQVKTSVAGLIEAFVRLYASQSGATLNM